jgi:hypothetical protein
MSEEKFIRDFVRKLLIRPSGRSRRTWKYNTEMCINPSNAELYPIYHLLALLGAHPILHVSRIRVNVVRWKVVDWIHLAKLGIALVNMVKNVK